MFPALRFKNGSNELCLYAQGESADRESPECARVIRRRFHSVFGAPNQGDVDLCYGEDDRVAGFHGTFAGERVFGGRVFGD